MDLGSLWDRYGIDLGSIWDRFGIICGSVWDRFGIVIWDHLGIDAGLIWDCSWIDLGYVFVSVLMFGECVPSRCFCNRFASHPVVLPTISCHALHALSARRIS